MRRRDFIRTMAGAALLAACQPAAAPTASPTPRAATPAPTPSPSPTPRALRKLKVGYIPLTDFLGMYAGMEQGYFRDESIEIELQAMAGGAAIIPAITGGSLDLGISNYVSVILAAAQGLDIKVISDSAYEGKAKPAHAIIVKKGGPIKSARDLNGKKVAVNTRNNIVHLGFMEWVERNGGDAKSLQFVELPFPQMPAALSQGQIDAAGIVEPFVTVATSGDAQILAPYFAELRDPMAVAGFVSTQKWIDQNKEVAAAFHRANTKGIQFVQQNEGKAREYAVKYANLRPDLAEKINLAVLRSTPLTEAVQFWIDMAKKWGVLDRTKDIKPEQLFVRF